MINIFRTQINGFEKNEKNVSYLSQCHLFVYCTGVWLLMHIRVSTPSSSERKRIMSSSCKLYNKLYSKLYNLHEAQFSIILGLKYNLMMMLCLDKLMIFNIAESIICICQKQKNFHFSINNFHTRKPL